LRRDFTLIEHVCDTDRQLTLVTDRSDLPEILQPCLERLFAHHVVRLRLALVPRHGHERPRAHVAQILIGYGESLRQVRPATIDDRLGLGLGEKRSVEETKTAAGNAEDARAILRFINVHFARKGSLLIRDREDRSFSSRERAESGSAFRQLGTIARPDQWDLEAHREMIIAP